jgi:mono/diheme cytochrome c family protein
MNALRHARRGLLGAVLLLGCNARVDLAIYGEAFVEDGIPADQVADGWQIAFDEFLIAVTDVELAGEDAIALDGSWVFDLTRPSRGRGHALASIAAPNGRYSALGYRFAPATDDAEGNASPEQIARIAAAGASLLVAATATRGDDEVRLQWAFTLDQGHACDLDLDVGPDDASAEITVHADHLFLDDPMLDPAIAFDLIASGDADGDGVVTTDELAAVDISGEARYQTANDDIDDLREYIGHLALTMGHVDGERGCAPQFVPRQYRDLYRDDEPIVAEPDASVGAQLFASHCASCHGAAGLGNGAAGEGLTPQPTDLTALTTAAQAPDYIHFRIAEGGAFFPYASAMPPFAGVLDDEAIVDLVAHVRALGGHH